MGDLSKNFSRHEFVCDCEPDECDKKYFDGEHWVCSEMAIDAELISVRQEECNYFANKLGIRKVTYEVTSGYRCDWWNGISKGKKNSKHPKRIANDGRILEVTPKEEYDYLCTKYPDRYGIGLYKDFVHLDVRKIKARWEIS